MVEAGYVIYRQSSPTEKYYFDKAMGRGGVSDVSKSHENNRVELKTFGRVPYVYYAGTTDFAKFNLKTVFHYNIDTGETAREQVYKFVSMINERRVLVVENSQREKFLCDVVITEESSPNLYVEEDMDYIEIGVECTEIDF